MSFASNFSGINPNANIGFGPAPIDNAGSLGGIAEQTQQQANNPVYGQQSPFQPPMPNPGMNPNVSIGGGPAPIDNGMSFGKSTGSGPFEIIGNQLGNQVANQIKGMAAQSPNPQSNVLGNALANTARQAPNQVMNSAFSGGLRPAPQNYRPPVRSGGILRRRMR